MAFPMLTIGKRRDDEKGKRSREFSARLFGMLTASAFWDKDWGSGSSQPLWLAYAAREQEAKAFTANLRDGRVVTLGNSSFRLESLTPYRFLEQATPEGLIVTAYIPALFDLEPASPYVDNVKFLFAPPCWWLDAQEAELEPRFGDDARDAARAALFAAYLDRRTALPILADLRFQLLLYREALEQEWIYRAIEGSTRTLAFTQSLALSGLDSPLGVRTTQDDISDLISTQTRLYAEEEQRHGTTRIETGGRLLSYPHTPPTQLCLDFELALATG